MRNSLAIALFIAVCLTACSPKLKPRESGGVEVTEVRAPMSKGEQPGYQAQLYNTSVKDAMSTFEKRVKSLDPDDMTTRGNEVFVDNANIPEMSTNRVDIYATFAEADAGNSVMTVFYDMGGAYLSKDLNAKNSNYAAGLVRNLGSAMSLDGMKETLDAQEGALRKMRNDQKDLKNDEEDLKKDLKRTQDRIADNAQRQGDLNAQMELKREEVKNTEKSVKDLK